MSSDREDLKRAFLARAGLAAAVRRPLPGDASTRSYERLHPARGASLILMDQAPSLESGPCPPLASAAERRALGYNASTRLAAGRVDAFVACAGWLRERGLSAPRVIAAEVGAGLAVLEDLGDGLYARLIEAGAEETPLYEAATDALLRIHREPPPAVLSAGGVDWPLLAYDGVALETYTDLFLAWTPRLAGAPPIPADAAAEWGAIWAPVRSLADAGASVFCHRDYHAENLIWLADRAGVARVGLLDFQDAVRAHPAWDLSMLLHDARRDVSPARREAVLARYLAARTELDAAAFRADFNALGAINIVRILGLFARLTVRDGKPRYRAFLPRLWRYLGACLNEGGLNEGSLRDLAPWLDRHVSPRARE